MLILSFDVGIKNLAYCLIDSDKNILDWDVLNCESSNTTLTMIEKLDSLDYLLGADIILIEKQPAFNPKMRIISNALFVYFTIRILHEQERKAKILFYSAKYKLRCCDVKFEFKVKSKYSKNKKLAVEHTKILLKTHQEFFLKHKKKDDLADCFLQGLSYINFYIKKND
jgi:hypothetical protein